MIKPILSRKKTGNDVFPALFCIFGFVFGITMFRSFGELFTGILSPDFTSAFESESPFSALLGCFTAELKYLLCLYMLGFCCFASCGCLCLAAYKGALVGFSAVYILGGAYSLPIYFTHLLCSAVNLIFLCCVCRLSMRFSGSAIGSGQPPSGKDILDYSFKCLFFTGAVLACTLLRHVILSFIS